MVSKKSPDVPEVVQTLMKDIPEEMQETIERDAQRLLKLPMKLDKDTAKLLLILAEQPAKVTETLYHLPGQLPENVEKMVETVREGFQYTDETSEKSRGERMRRVTDVIDLFTPT